MADLVVPLSRTYGETGRPFDRLTFRSPRWQDFLDLGDIEEWQPVSAEGNRAMLVRHHDVVASYAERCLKEPHTVADLALLDLPDVLAVHEGIRDFFGKARASREPPTSSSGDTAKGSTTSAA